MILAKRDRIRFGLTLVEVLVIIAVIVVIICLLMPGIHRVHVPDGRSMSQNNLRQVILAMHNHASTFDGKIPVGYCEFAGKTGSFFFHVLPSMERETLYQVDIGSNGKDVLADPVKPYVDPFDPMAVNTCGHLSYALNGNFAYLDEARRIPADHLLLPDSFKERGTSNTVAVAQRTAGNIRQWSCGGDIVNHPYFQAGVIDFLRPNLLTDGATAFLSDQTQVGMMDGSVRTVTAKQGNRPGSAFEIACRLNDSTKTPLPPDW